jgi:hypothetical protein
VLPNLIFCRHNETESAAGCKCQTVDTVLLKSKKGDRQDWFLYFPFCICKGIDWERENKCKGICSETVKVGGVVGLIGTVKGREELDERKREQDEYSTRKGL